jgi:hypothetical protein
MTHFQVVSSGESSSGFTLDASSSSDVPRDGGSPTGEPAVLTERRQRTAARSAASDPFRHRLIPATLGGKPMHPLGTAGDRAAKDLPMPPNRAASGFQPVAAANPTGASAVSRCPRQGREATVHVGHHSLGPRHGRLAGDRCGERDHHGPSRPRRLHLEAARRHARPAGGPACAVDPASHRPHHASGRWRMAAGDPSTSSPPATVTSGGGGLAFPLDRPCRHRAAQLGRRRFPQPFSCGRSRASLSAGPECQVELV